VSVASSATDTPWAVGWDCHVHLFARQAAQLGDHYAARDARLCDIEAAGGAQGVGHLVLVQPSVYGHDNHLLLQALAHSAGRHRGVVVVDHADADFNAWHALGVRGVRINLVSPVGQPASPHRLLMALTPTLRALNWHVQWYVQPQQLTSLLPLQARCGVPFVLDHLAGMHAELSADDAAWQALAALAAGGAWVKLSGWYRLRAQPPYATLHRHIERVATLFGDRLVWASDWPHTSFAPDQMPSYASQWQPVVDVLGAARAAALRDEAPLRLYA
jgi:predicted TIM-barrel fold metal-dependent hydrolase